MNNSHKLNEIFCSKSVEIIKKIQKIMKSEEELLNLHDLLISNVSKLKEALGNTRFKCVSGEYKGQTLTLESIFITRKHEIKVSAYEIYKSRINISDIEFYSNAEGVANLIALPTAFDGPGSNTFIDDGYWTESLSDMYPELTKEMEDIVDRLALASLEKKIIRSIEDKSISEMKDKIRFKNTIMRGISAKTGNAYRVVGFEFDLKNKIVICGEDRKKSVEIPLGDFIVIDNSQNVVEFNRSAKKAS